jgi:endoglucanase
LTNTGAGSIMGWTLSFTFAGSITSIWNANIVSHVGNVYVIKNATYNSLISPNQAVSIGFNANGGNATTGPTSYVLNGVSIT